jgi:hypothetical protein
VVRTRISATAATYAGRIYYGGRLVCTVRFRFLQVLGVVIDVADWWNDPDGFWDQPAYSFPGMLVFPNDYNNLIDPPQA